MVSWGWNQRKLSLACPALDGWMCSGNFLKRKVRCFSHAEPAFTNTSDYFGNTALHSFGSSM